MNALISLDSILEPQQALTATSLFGSGQVETILAAIEKDVRAELYDVATEEGRERIKSVAYKIARSKTTLDDIGKEHVATIKAQSAAIDKERKTLRDRLDALKDEIRKPVTDWETAEADRVSGYEGAIVAIIETARQAPGKTSAMIRELIGIVSGYAVRDWQEFHERAEVAVSESLTALNDALAVAEQRERDAAELEALRKEKAEREERDRIEALQKAQAERAAQQAAERAAEEQAKREWMEKHRAEAEERAAKQAEEAAARAVEQERRRQEQEARDAATKKAAEDAAERKRQENKRHREKVHARIAAGLIACGCVDTEGHAQAIVSHIVSGNLPNLKIEY